MVKTVRIDGDSFGRICEHMHRNFGINLTPIKQYLVENRLSSRLRHFGFDNYQEYTKYIFSTEGQCELNKLSDYLSTNQTYFYREPKHFSFFNDLLEKWPESKRMSIWSAAASSGDEAYTLAMLIQEFSDKSKKQFMYDILGTDISNNMLEKAQKAIYSASNVSYLPNYMIKKYFISQIGPRGEVQFKFTDALKKNIQFKKLNLIKEINSMQRKFDVIFCRNVLIYFDNETKSRICKELTEYLNPGGYIFLGHCEGLVCRNNNVKQMQPSIFQKV